MRLGPFGRWHSGRDPIEAQAAARIKQAMRELLGLGEDAVIAVNEILCADPACPGTETVILVMNPGFKTKAFKAQAAMTELERDHLAALIAAAPA